MQSRWQAGQESGEKLFGLSVSWKESSGMGVLMGDLVGEEKQ